MEMSREPELTEGTWLQLMCCTPSRPCCLKFWGNGVHGVHECIPEYSGGDGVDSSFMQKGALWSIYELILSYMIVFVFVSMGMNVSMKRKDNKTVLGHNKRYNQKGT